MSAGIAEYDDQTAPAVTRVSAAPPVCNMALLVGDDLQIDVQLPATVPLGEMILDCWDTIAAELHRRGYEPTESPTDSPGVWSLARVGGLPLDPEQTLDDYGIKDGTLMVLTNTPTTPKFEPMIESAATLVAKTNADSFRKLTPADARWAGAGFLAAATLLSCAVAWRAWVVDASILPGIVLLVIAALEAGVVAVAARQATEDSTPLVRVLSVAAIAPAAVGTAALLPGSLSAGHLVAATAVITGLSILTLQLLRTNYIVLTAMASSGALLLLLSVLRAQWHWSYVSAGALVAIVAMVLRGYDWQIAARLAGIALSAFPSATGRFVFATTSPDRTAPMVPDPDHPIPSPQVMAEKSRRGNQQLTGLTVGMGIALVVSTVLMVDPEGPRRTVALILALILAAIVVLAGRDYVDRYQAVIVTATGLAMAGGAVTRWVWVWPNGASIAIVAGLIWLVAAAGLVAAVAAPKVEFSAVTRGAVEAIRYLLILSVIPLCLVVLDLLTAVRRH